jgi:hypothetical protein
LEGKRVREKENKTEREQGGNRKKERTKEKGREIESTDYNKKSIVDVILPER